MQIINSQTSYSNYKHRSTYTNLTEIVNILNETKTVQPSGPGSKIPEKVYRGSFRH